MTFINRDIGANLLKALDRGKSILLLGPRQVGKTTLIHNLVTPDIKFTFADPEIRLRYEKDLLLLGREIKKFATGRNTRPLVVIDEVQKIPIVMDTAQHLIDDKIAQFILTGSSVRKLRRSQDINLLPGRVVSLEMDPLTLSELPTADIDLESLLLYGSLPEIYLEADNDNKEIDLRSYVTGYLDEEIRAEAAVRNLGSFARFLEVSASEAGNIVNASKLSNDIGVSSSTITDYYQILQDCLITHRIDPLIDGHSRRRLIKSPKYLFFDLGVRRVAANEGSRLSQKQLGLLFEQFVGLELIRLSHRQHSFKVRYWRDSSGPEVDYVLEVAKKYIPIEVKWSDSPDKSDVKHLELFLNDYPQATRGYVVCRTPHPYDITDRITAISYLELRNLVDL